MSSKSFVCYVCNSFQFWLYIFFSEISNQYLDYLCNSKYGVAQNLTLIFWHFLVTEGISFRLKDKLIKMRWNKQFNSLVTLANFDLSML